MNLMTISEVARAFNISTRTLRYYDEIGLLPSTRKEGYAYRAYDESAIRRLRQIITLRKLRIPLKKIALIFENTEEMIFIEVLEQSVNGLDGEIAALQTIRDILRMFLTRLNSVEHTEARLNLLDDFEIIGLIQTLSPAKTNLREERSMESLNKANETLSILKNVRILYLPPCTVAASHYIGENPENGAEKPLAEFIRGIGLSKIKPDFRVFGFNSPCPDGKETYGYEFWVTVPDGLAVPVPLEKKRFAGGLYAAHCIRMGDFSEWDLLGKWIQNSAEYEFDQREPLGMGGCLEEHLNAYTCYEADGEPAEFTQLDLLMPIKRKAAEK